MFYTGLLGTTYLHTYVFQILVYCRQRRYSNWDWLNKLEMVLIVAADCCGFERVRIVGAG